MKLNNLFNQAKRVVEQRGGTDALKRDAEELRKIAKSKGTAQDKAKRAAEALKDPGAPEGARKDRAAPRKDHEAPRSTRP